MIEIQSSLEGIYAGMMGLVPLSFAVSAWLTSRSRSSDGSGAWSQANFVAASAMALAISVAIAAATTGGGILRAAVLPGIGGADPIELNLRMDPVACAMLLLVTFIGLVIVRFSRRYLDGDPGFLRYLRWLQATLAAVTLLVLTNNLLLLALSWIATSLALHQLLTHFPERPPALIAAHKKFLASRLAELSLLAAIGSIRSSVGSFEMDALFAHLAAVSEPDRGLEGAALLLTVAAVLKCAQIPFHGWLIQVMEAPTPVSALLHAGVVNIGGFLMIRLAPLMVEVESVQLLLVAWGATNAVVAALVMTTRVSIKVALAWSTCAQMGFMLLECGLGAYSLALLHLLAHSLYKAHAFLSAGSVVELFRIQSLSAAKSAVPLHRWLGAVPVVALAMLPAAILFRLDPRQEPALWALGPIVVCALVPLAVRGLAGGLDRFALAFAGCAGVAALYGLWHACFGALLDSPGSPGSPDTSMTLRIAIALACFGFLFGVQGILSARPSGRLASALYPRLFAGLYLDDLFTRLTFRIWPARLPLLEDVDAHRNPLQ